MVVMHLKGIAEDIACIIYYFYFVPNFLLVSIMLCYASIILNLVLLFHQRAGYTVQAERLNFLRFISFFRAVHRGASFAGLRTTSVRKLLPE